MVLGDEDSSPERLEYSVADDARSINFDLQSSEQFGTTWGIHTATKCLCNLSQTVVCSAYLQFHDVSARGGADKSRPDRLFGFVERANLLIHVKETRKPG